MLEYKHDTLQFKTKAKPIINQCECGHSQSMVQQLEDLTKNASLANCAKRKDFAL